MGNKTGALFIGGAIGIGTIFGAVAGEQFGEYVRDNRLGEYNEYQANISGLREELIILENDFTEIQFRLGETCVRQIRELGLVDAMSDPETATSPVPACGDTTSESDQAVLDFFDAVHPIETANDDIDFAEIQADAAKQEADEALSTGVVLGGLLGLTGTTLAILLLAKLKDHFGK